ncbi:hypothetical protein K502DRAFT_348407 [Neoconidiobolus thromboides FSU 785]|nr:hypothetical protein K502DRAFT_348407 [Neoconidiobolus thromboides FSU 785]
MNNQNKAKKQDNQLNTVVNKLTKAALGASASDIDIEDPAELNSYISNMLLQEAKKKEKLFEKYGTTAYLNPLQSFERTTKPDKQFLSNIIKHTNSHNRHLLKQEKISKEMNIKDHKSKASHHLLTINRLLDSKNNNDKKENKRKKDETKESEREKDKSKKKQSRREDEFDSNRKRDRFEGNKKEQEKEIKFKGRGKVGLNRMDKYFKEDYNAKMDFDDLNCSYKNNDEIIGPMPNLK